MAASMLQSLLERTDGLSEALHKLFGGSPQASSSAASSCPQIVEDLEKLRRRLKRIRSLLDDAEEREIREKHVRLWLDELRNVHHDAEDVIAEFEYQLLCLPQHAEQEEHAATTQEKGGINWNWEFQQKIVGMIKKVNDMFYEIYQDGLKLRLHGEVEDGWRHMGSLLDLPRMTTMSTSSMVNEKDVHGREKDWRKVMKMLLPDVNDDRVCDENVDVVSLVGMGGIGKTTLAQLIYNDNEVKKHFETRSWICVSQPFDVTRVTKDILEGIQGRPSEVTCGLQERLHVELKGKRFLLVLDDVWNENQEQWESLWLCLSRGAKGSKVLITTRNVMVSRISRVSPANIYWLGCLSEKDSWLLFEQRVFGGRSSGDYSNLVRMGQQIVKKCRGLPLTVKTLAGLLFSEFREERWEDILKSDLWELPAGEKDILPALKLSYHYLPSPTKPCFAYCAVFPKNHHFDRDQLVLMWMAQDYLKPTANRCMEDVGRGYFEELLQRSIFQTQGESYIMHDLTHDMALSVWGGQCCEIANGKLPKDKARHVSFQCSEDNMRLFSTGPVHCLTRLRTLGMFKIHWGYTCSNIVVNNLLLSMKYLHVLDLRGVEVSELPDSVGNLKLLRYIAVGRALLRRLPESLGDLLNLQTLDVSEAYSLQELPERVKELINLRHLILHVAGHSYHGVQMMPQGIGRLTQLRTLTRFVVGEGRGAAGIEELTDLDDLQGKLELKIKKLPVFKSKNSKEACILKNKRGLQSLSVVFQCQQNALIESQLIESLQPHTNVKELEIVWYSGGRIPTWMGTGASPFWSLEKLSLSSRFGRILSLGAEKGGTFPRLRQLTMEYCYGLEHVKLWHLTALKELRINCCPSLTELNCYCVFNPVLSSSGLEQQRVVVDHILLMPHVHTVELRHCPDLILSLVQQQQRLSPSLRRIDVTGSPRLEVWVKRYKDKLVGHGALCVVQKDEMPSYQDFEATEFPEWEPIKFSEPEPEWEQAILLNRYPRPLRRYPRQFISPEELDVLTFLDFEGTESNSANGSP